jgi:hypothetical protein
VTTDEIIVVTGMQRSGTTCMMRMLEAGGIPLYYETKRPLEFTENGTDFINYNILLRESEKLNRLKDGDHSWMKECHGKAVKILNPAKVRIPKGPRYYFIWMNRKIKHCARSNRKFMLLNARDSRSIHVSRHALHGQAGIEEIIEYIKDYKMRGWQMLKKYPRSEIIQIQFEAMLKSPKLVAVIVQRFLGRYLDVDAMARVVVKRPAHCLKNMLEEKIYNN